MLDILGRFDEAIQTYQEMVDATSHANGAYTDEEKNNRSIFLERLGAVYLEDNKTEPAIAAYQKMIDMGEASRRADTRARWKRTATPTSSIRRLQSPARP